MSHGAQRNQPCWCGSGKKRKLCHPNSDNDVPTTPWEYEGRLIAEFGRKVCVAPKGRSECGGQIVKAHTVSRRGSLERIARQGHVYTFVPSLQNLNAHGGALHPVLRGIGAASTFTGFCAKHDNELFAPLEKVGFTATAEQCLLVGYRSLAREYFTKSSQLRMKEVYRHDLEALKRSEPAMASLLSAHYSGVEIGLRDVLEHKRRFEAVLTSHAFDSVRAYVVEFNGIQPILASGSLYPEFDFDGNEIVPPGSLLPSLLSHASLCGRDQGTFVMVWLPDSDPGCLPLVRSFHRLGNHEAGAAIVRFLFEYCENVHMRPQWWDEQSEAVRQQLIQRMASAMRFAAPRLPNCLCPDGVTLDPWPIRARRTIGFSL